MIRFFLIALLAALTVALPARAEIELEETETDSGIEAWLMEEPSIPFIAMEIKFRGGSVTDPDGKLGAANLMSALLEEGAGDLDARAFARERDALAMSISSRVNRDSLSISAKFLTENREESLALLRTVLTEPRFDADAIERVRGQVLSSLRSDLKDPQAIAGRELDKLLYAGHPYANPEDGTIETVSALTRGDLVAAHRRLVTRHDLSVSIVGDVTEAEARRLIDALFAGLPDEGPALPGPVTPDLPGGIKVVDQETPQSVVRFAQPGLPREHPDFFAAFLLNHILGGSGFESRLMTEVREKRGLTYGIYSYLSDPTHSEILAGGAATANARVAETVSVIRDEWRRLHDEGVTAEELADAKTYLTGSYPLRFDGNGPIANIAVNMQFDGMEPDYIATRNDKVNAVTLEDVNRVASELLDPERLTFVLVGQPEGLETTLN